MQQRRRLSQRLGIELPEWEDEGGAPPVDEGAILGMLDTTADQEQQQRVWLLIWRFRSWAMAYCRLSIKPPDNG